MPVLAPSADQIRDIAAAFGISMSAERSGAFHDLIGRAFASYARLDEIEEPKPVVMYPRAPGYRPPPEENPYNAWYWKTEIRSAREGPLAGRTVALKDNICLAGVPMMNGSRTLEGYVPDVDATVVTRILAAGGIIAGKAACEDLCCSGNSHTNALAEIRNPWRPTHSSGGSSAGSAALVAAGAVDMALGTDQAGSIRIPASWCGIYGLKPTYGLVPYTGIFSMEFTLDHCGPMGRSVEDVARLLAVIAGPDGYDSRQERGAVHPDYTLELGRDIKGLRLAALREGFGRPEGEPVVDEKVRAALARFRDLGAEVSEVSIPWHIDGLHIWSAIAFEGVTAQMMKGNGMGTNWDGYYVGSLIEAFACGWRSRPDDLPDTVKMLLIVGEFLHREHHGRYYAKARNLAFALRRAYDHALENCDVLVLPTTAMRAAPIPPRGCSLAESVGGMIAYVGNTCPFDVTGHPALNVPCALVDGLPVGMMLVGRHREDGTLLRAAHAFTAGGEWQKM